MERFLLDWGGNNLLLSVEGKLLFFFLIYDFLYFWLCWVFTVCMGFSLVAVRRLLIAVASHVAERGF